MLTLSDQDLLNALLEAQHHHKSIKVYLPDGNLALNSTVLGFDYYARTILLDSLTPPIRGRQAKTLEKTPFWLQLRHDGSMLNIFCTLDECQYDLYTLKILQHEFTDNQRWFSRIHFDVRTGPSLSIEIPHELPIEGHIRNLSVHGAMVEFYGDDVRERLGTQTASHCRMRFNDLFDVQLQAEIRQAAFLRKPSCHSALRLVFRAHNDVSYAQLDNFINAFQENADPRHITNRSTFACAQMA